MKSHRRRRRIRALALALAACTAVAAPAGAQPADSTPAQPSSTQATPTIKIGDTPGDVATGARWTALAHYYATSDAKVGDTPADFAQPVAPAPKVGDTPVDDPGASRAPQYAAPPTIQVVRPERTIVRDVDQVLPIVLSSAALLLALGGCTFLLVASIRRRQATHTTAREQTS